MADPPSVNTASGGDPELPRSIFVPDPDPNREAREVVYSILSDSFMAFLSLLLVPIILVPIFVSLPPSVLLLLDGGDVTIVVFFVAEYVSKLYLAKDRWEYFRSPWHLVDLAVILLSFVSYLPFLGLKGKGSLVLLLRLIRLPRVFAVAGRAAGGRLGHDDASGADAGPEPQLVIRQVDADRPSEVHVLSWAELEQHLESNRSEWIQLSNFSEDSLLELSAALRIPERHFQLDQVDELWPHAGRVERTILLFLQSGEIRYPKGPREFYTIAGRGAIVILRGPKVISLSPHGIDLSAPVTGWLERSPEPTAPFPLQVVEALMTATLRDYRSLLSDIDLEVGAISRVPRSRLPKDFLPRMYEIQKATGRLSTNLGRFRHLLDRITSGRTPVEGIDEKAKARLDDLADETGFLSEIARDTSDNVGALIDVYINQSSFDTNRILKILAVITAVAIIPATVGGLLGINGPFLVELWLVVLGVALTMTFVAYCFVKLGWLRV